MSESNRALVKLTFGDGSVIDTFTRYSLKDSFPDPLGKLEFECSPPRDQVVKHQALLKKGELATLFVGAANQGGFLITRVRTRVSTKGGVVFSVHAASPLVTPMEASIDPFISKHYQTDAPVETVVLEALSPYGFTEIVVDSSAHYTAITGRALDKQSPPLKLDALKHKDIEGQEGEAAYEFCRRIFRRLGCCLRMNYDGRLLLTAPDYEQSVSYSACQGRGDGDYFIGDVEIDDTNDGQYSECRVRGSRVDAPAQGQPAVPSAHVKASLLFPSRTPYQSTVHATKPKIIYDKHARDTERCTSVAKLALGKPASQSFVVSGSVDGHVSTTGRVWSVGTICHVRVDALQLEEDMFVLERTLHGDAHGAQVTSLKLIPKYSLQLGDVPR